MSEAQTVQHGMEPTGRYIVTFREGGEEAALSAINKACGVTRANMMNSADFGVDGIEMMQVPGDGGVLFGQIGVAVVAMDEDAMRSMNAQVDGESAILAVEPEGMMYALGDSNPLTSDYLRGFRDAADAIYTRSGQPRDSEDSEAAASFGDNNSHTWGLQATKAAGSRYSGRGIRVAVLDTGLDLRHPDFIGRGVVSKSFISGVTSAQDGHGHGTHCTGTACGPLQPRTGRRYGVAYRSQVYIGKVLSDQGGGADASILAGIDWAIRNQCQVISMSLGAVVCSTSVAYETVGQRALNAGTLIVAAAGNNSNRSQGVFGCVNRPANSRTFMAVGAVDNNVAIANFSAADTTRTAGTAVDIAGPGVAVYSSWPMPTYSRTISGTSMATPHVAGIAALWAEATSARGAALWQRLITNAKSLNIPHVDVGRGLVLAP